MEITINEFKSKLNYYLNLAQNEDVYVVQDGKNTIKLSKATKDPVEELTGILSHIGEDIDEKTIREERLAENLTDKENSNFHS